jgi:SAM-dependent methyltransferase
MAMKPSLCPVCGTLPVLLWHDWLFRCNGCGLLSSTLEPAIPVSSDVSRIDEASRARGLDPVRQRNNGRIIEELKSLKGGGRFRILDVGCGQGQFLVDATAHGYSVVGIEPDANVAPQTATRTNVEVRQGFFPDVVQAHEQFDAIIFNDVFEHIPNAAGAIAACARHLAPGGVLVLNCPNRDGVFYWLGDILDRVGSSAPFDRLWQRNLPSPHVWYFTPQHLLRIGQSVGLSQRAVVTLLPIVREGLADRIFHIDGQSKVLGVATYLATLVALPMLHLMPHDIGVVFLSKPDLADGASA